MAIVTDWDFRKEPVSLGSDPFIAGQIPDGTPRAMQNVRNVAREILVDSNARFNAVNADVNLTPLGKQERLRAVANEMTARLNALKPRVTAAEKDTDNTEVAILTVAAPAKGDISEIMNSHLIVEYFSKCDRAVRMNEIRKWLQEPADVQALAAICNAPKSLELVDDAMRKIICDELSRRKNPQAVKNVEDARIAIQGAAFAIERVSSFVVSAGQLGAGDSAESIQDRLIGGAVSHSA